MNYYKILFKNADGENRLTQAIGPVKDGKEALQYTTDFVRANLIEIHKVSDPMEQKSLFLNRHV